MATLPTRSFATIVSNIAAGIQGRLSVFLNFTTGSAFRAVAEAYAGASLWMQAMVLQVANLTRLSTSYGSDVDSWLADYELIARLGSVAATGLVVFSRFTASASAPVIPVGATVKTSDGSQVFRVYADTTNAGYSPTIVSGGGYIMPAQVVSLIVPVQSITPSPNGTILNGVRQPGANGNVAVGAISLLNSQITGVDKVTNPAAFVNGSDQETDEAVKSRFRLAIASLSKGTSTAIQSAITNLQTGLQVLVLDGENLDGSINPGMVSVVIDDGSGAASDALLASAQAAANSVRAAGVQMGVYAASRKLVGVALTLSVLPGYSRANVAALLSANVALGINSTGLGNELPFFEVAALATNTLGVAKIDGLTVNGGTADIAGDPRYTIKCSGVVVN